MRTYKFNLSIKCLVWSMIHLAVLTAVGTAIYLRYDGSVFFTWFALCVVASLVLMTLSIPRHVVVSEESLNIHCLLEVTSIELNQIVSVRRVASRKIRWVIPIFAGCGFFGYYGIFFDYRHMRLFRIYAGEWRNIVEIIDADDDYYYVSCREGDDLVAQLTQQSGCCCEDSF